MGATTNYFSNAYIDVNNLARSANFSTDFDGQPYSDYDPEVAKELLQQEAFGDYFLVNAVGGKSWKVKDYYVGFFAVINNILDQEYKTGGFEQGRKTTYFWPSLFLWVWDHLLLKFLRTILNKTE